MTTAITTADWTVLDIDGVTNVARTAAARVAGQYRYVAEYDDLYQDALIRLAQAPDVVRDYLTDPDKGLDLLRHWLWCDLVDTTRTEAARRNRHVSYEQVREAAE